MNSAQAVSDDAAEAPPLLEVFLFGVSTTLATVGALALYLGVF